MASPGDYVVGVLGHSGQTWQRNMAHLHDPQTWTCKAVVRYALRPSNTYASDSENE